MISLASRVCYLQILVQGFTGITVKISLNLLFFSSWFLIAKWLLYFKYCMTSPVRRGTSQNKRVHFMWISFPVKKFSWLPHSFSPSAYTSLATKYSTVSHPQGMLGCVGFFLVHYIDDSNKTRVLLGEKNGYYACNQKFPTQDIHISTLFLSVLSFILDLIPFIFANSLYQYQKLIISTFKNIRDWRTVCFGKILLWCQEQFSRCPYPYRSLIHWLDQAINILLN